MGVTDPILDKFTDIVKSVDLFGLVINPFHLTYLLEMDQFTHCDESFLGTKSNL